MYNSPLAGVRAESTTTSDARGGDGRALGITRRLVYRNGVHYTTAFVPGVRHTDGAEATRPSGAGRAPRSAVQTAPRRRDQALLQAGRVTRFIPEIQAELHARNNCTGRFLRRPITMPDRVLFGSRTSQGMLQAPPVTHSHPAVVS